MRKTKTVESLKAFNVSKQKYSLYKCLVNTGAMNQKMLLNIYMFDSHIITLIAQVHTPNKFSTLWWISILFSRIISIAYYQCNMKQSVISGFLNRWQFRNFWRCNNIAITGNIFRCLWKKANTLPELRILFCISEGFIILKDFIFFKSYYLSSF